MEKIEEQWNDTIERRGCNFQSPRNARVKIVVGVEGEQISLVVEKFV